MSPVGDWHQPEQPGLAVFGDQVLWRDRPAPPDWAMGIVEHEHSRVWRARGRTALLTLLLAPFMVIGLTIAQAKWNTGTWAYCQFSPSYGCHVWLRLYQRGGTE